MDNTASSPVKPTFFSRLTHSLKLQWRGFLDLSVRHTQARWIFFFISAVFFAIRAYSLNGFYIVTYALGIYILNLFIGFISPQVDPVSDGPLLPNYDKDEFKPFVRRLPEFKFWYAALRGIYIAFFMTFVRLFDIPVYWPVLVVYFCVLFFLTMRRQLKHMIQYKYIPFTYGKPKFSGSRMSAEPAINGGSGPAASMARARPAMSATPLPKATVPTAASAGFSGYVQNQASTIRNVNPRSISRN
eukprot:14537_1